jgi:hypothetical protein
MVMVNKRNAGRVLFALSLIVCNLSTAADSPDKARRSQRGEQGDTWASIAKLPDWSGAWSVDSESLRKAVQATLAMPPNPNLAPLNGKWEAYRMARIQKGAAAGARTASNGERCLPNGMPSLMQGHQAFEFFFAPGRVNIVWENGEVRRIYTDGRMHPDDPDLSWEGHSIGHWEAGTLVVDTVGIKATAEVITDIPNASSNVHVVERIHFNNADKKLEDDVTVTNPDQFVKPYVFIRTAERVPEMIEYVCENNRVSSGTGGIDLTPPKTN